MKIWRKLLFIFIFLSSSKQLEAWLIAPSTFGVIILKVASNWGPISFGLLLAGKLCLKQLKSVRTINKCGKEVTIMSSNAKQDTEEIQIAIVKTGEQISENCEKSQKQQRALYETALAVHKAKMEASNRAWLEKLNENMERRLKWQEFYIRKMHISNVFHAQQMREVSIAAMVDWWLRCRDDDLLREDFEEKGGEDVILGIQGAEARLGIRRSSDTAYKLRTNNGN